MAILRALIGLTAALLSLNQAHAQPSVIRSGVQDYGSSVSLTRSPSGFAVSSSPSRLYSRSRLPLATPTTEGRFVRPSIQSRLPRKHDRRTCIACRNASRNQVSPSWTGTTIGQSANPPTRAYICPDERLASAIAQTGRTQKESIASVHSELVRQMNSRPHAREMIRLVPKGTNAYVRNYINFAGDPLPIMPDELKATPEALKTPPPKDSGKKDR